MWGLWRCLTVFVALDSRRSQRVILYWEPEQILPNSWTGLTNCLRDPNGSLDAAIHPLFFNAGPTGLGFRKQHWLQRKVSPSSLPSPISSSLLHFLSSPPLSLHWTGWLELLKSARGSRQPRPRVTPTTWSARFLFFHAGSPCGSASTHPSILVKEAVRCAKCR